MLSKGKSSKDKYTLKLFLPIPNYISSLSLKLKKD